MSFQQPSSASLIWFLLLDSVTGEPYKSTTASSILYSSLIVPVIADFRDAVKAKNSSILSSFDAADLLIFKNKYYFDKRNAIDGKEEPLAPTEYIGSLGSKEDMLVVVVPSSMEKASPSSDKANNLTFVEYLKQGNIDRPETQVLATIAKRYSQQLQAVLSVGSTECCTDLYRTVKDLPTSITRGVIEETMNISINGPISLAQPNILIAADQEARKHLFIKLLRIPRIPETTESKSFLSKQEAVNNEINACIMLSNPPILGLVKSDVVNVTGVWTALKMKRYYSSLNESPQLCEDWVYCGFSRIFNALKAMHELDLVHMDVKSDNVFLDENYMWDLGDFGSTRQIGTPVWSFTQVLNPYTIPKNATVIPAMDYVLLCVMIAIELKKFQWKNLCGLKQNVQAHLIIERLESIKNVKFKEELLKLFVKNFKIVEDHLKNY